jgi:hypothetical protein
MNERIRELHSKVVSESENMRWNIEDSKKLTELIVRECADIAYQSLYEDRVFDDVPANIRRNVMDAIKQHFGVRS